MHGVLVRAALGVHGSVGYRYILCLAVRREGAQTKTGSRLVDCFDPVNSPDNPAAGRTGVHQREGQAKPKANQALALVKAQPDAERQALVPVSARVSTIFELLTST